MAWADPSPMGLGGRRQVAGKSPEPPKKQGNNLGVVIVGLRFYA